MAIRRPRIKAVANIGAIKRRAKIESNEISFENMNKITATANSSNLFHDDNNEKDSKELSRTQLPATESVIGGFSSPNGLLNPLNFSQNQEQDKVQNVNNSICSPPSKEQIPARYRKISSMEDTLKLSSARKEFHSNYNRKCPEKSSLKLSDFIFYNPTSNPMVFQTKQEKIDVYESEIDSKFYHNESEFKEEKSQSLKVQIEERAPVPQLKLGPNGEIVLDEKSLVIETTAEKQARSVLSASKTAIVLDEYSGNNGFYSRKKRTKEWTSEETMKFYKCLHTIGTDFSLMLSLFPDRNRRDLKLKFKKEERNNGALINKTLLHPNTFDMEILKNDLEKDEKLAEIRRKEDEEKKIKLQRKINEKVAIYNKCDNRRKGIYYSRAMNNLSEGNLALNLADIKNEKKSYKKHQNKINVNSSNEENLNISQSVNCIKNENYFYRNIESNDFVQSNQMKTDENEIDADIELDDVVSVNSICYDDSYSIEITDIGDILPLEDTLSQFSNSTLALVSKRDKNNPENDTHGIYMFCHATGIMSQKPLDLPKDTVNSILTAMGKI